MGVVAVGTVDLIIGLVLETWLVYKAIKNTRRARLLARVPWSKIGQLRPGPVKVRGRALADRGLLRSPLAGRKCVYYHIQAKKLVHWGDSSRWKTVVNDASGAAFALHDGTGSVTIWPNAAEFVLHRDTHEYEGSCLFRKLEYFETRIEEGDVLVVLGTARDLSGAGWELVPGDAPLLVSDKGLAELLRSYKNAAALWWAVAVLLPIIAIAARDVILVTLARILGAIP